MNKIVNTIVYLQRYESCHKQITHSISYADLNGESFFDKMKSFEQLLILLKEEGFVLKEEEDCIPFYLDRKHDSIEFDLIDMTFGNKF